MDNFRKIDIDQYDEDVILESELYEPDPRDPAQVMDDVKQKASAVRSSLAKGDIAGALNLVLDDAPYGPNVDEARNLNLQTLLSILNSTKATEIPGVVKSLTPDAQDTLMKYLYKGMALPGWGDVSGSVLLGWHEKLTEAAGTGCITPSATAHPPSPLPTFMPSRPAEVHPKDVPRNKSSRIHSLSSTQYGDHSHHPLGILLRFPGETLTHITSFLDPLDLLALGQTNRQLYEHVKDDNTWRRAYVYQFLGIGPEGDLHDNSNVKNLLLRREESTWRKEFMTRCALRRRWEWYGNTTVTHIPVHSPVTSIHLTPSGGLLSSSFKYGIVSRSLPLNGRVLRGYFDATGVVNGLGIGNPNVEFSPHVTAIAVSSEGAGAKIVWGFRHGEVAVTTANRAMDMTRPSAARHTRCAVEECHLGMVHDAAWGRSADGLVAFVTAGADGRVKLWDAKRIRCLWTSERRDALVPDPYLKAVVDIPRGVVVAATKSGEVIIWSGFISLLSEDQMASGSLAGVCEMRIPAPPAPIPTGVPLPGNSHPEIWQLHYTFNSPAQLSILAAYRDDPHFYRITADLSSGTFERTTFGNGSTGPIRALQPVFAREPSQSSFVITGDQLGCIHVYAWDATQSATSSSVPSAQTFEAHEDGAITALAWNPVIIVSGSERGTVKVWDSLTFAPIRSFSSPMPRAAEGDGECTTQIALERDVLVASVGNRVVALRAGPVGKHRRALGKAKQSSGTSARHASVAKWHKQVEMHRDIAESCRVLEEEQQHVRRVFGREREQHSALSHLGLSEVEAVEYVLMLSRDEEEARLRAGASAPSASTSSRQLEEGVFLDDFDLQTPVTTPSADPRLAGRPATGTVSPFWSPPSGSSSPYANGHTHTLVSQSHHKVQVSPRVRPEPMEAGFSASPLDGAMAALAGGSQSVAAPSPDDPEHFPPVSRTPSSTGASVPSTPRSSSHVSGSPTSFRSAWSTPLQMSRSNGGTPSVQGSVPSSPVIAPRHGASSGPSGVSQSLAGNLGASGPLPAQNGASGEWDDDEIRFAIELSLAEARSRGDMA
ncbi:hypothetical protein CERSUDRAFT_99136 [Gelatoporia subvermispora B]|uniref:Actin-related protein 2/3 complex subunit 5 n=1 Tax=Ceriporiopsis subvermispora (strain B) TaxID=914234 RepID=M2PB28_CERS8|nr:hypothetical protein CERSUDRAFT_99136 [Gelatoporia subvermispora B]